MNLSYDAVIVPNGGLRAGGIIPPYVMSRLERAAELAPQAREILLLGRGTSFKPQPKDVKGFEISDAAAYARFLSTRLEEPDKIRTEETSICSISNAYFARLHTDQLNPGEPIRLAVVNSQFHLPRTELVFNWVFGLNGTASYAPIDYHATANTGVRPQALDARLAKEGESIERFHTQTIEGSLRDIHSMADLREWIYTQHDWFKPQRVRGQVLDPILDETY